jgi:E3 ubiquitin-protein ligase HERC2
MGKEGKYDLRLAESSPAVENDGDEEEEEESTSMSIKAEENPHPTSLLLKASIHLLKTLGICMGLHGNEAQKEAVGVYCGLLRTIVDSGCSAGISE